MELHKHANELRGTKHDPNVHNFKHDVQEEGDITTFTLYYWVADGKGESYRQVMTAVHDANVNIMDVEMIPIKRSMVNFVDRSVFRLTRNALMALSGAIDTHFRINKNRPLMIAVRKKEINQETYQEKSMQLKEQRKEMLLSTVLIRKQLDKYGCIRGMTYFETE